MSTALNILADDKNIVIYRRKFNLITGSVIATILLQQIIHWDGISKNKPFFKFKQPCKNKLYKEGDSWMEELGFTRTEFDNAIKKIGTKIVKGMSKSEELRKTDRNHLIIYWTDSSRITWYYLNKPLLDKAMDRLYLDKAMDQLYLGKAGNQLYLVNQLIDFTLLTKTTTETTTDIKDLTVTAIEPKPSINKKAPKYPNFKLFIGELSRVTQMDLRIKSNAARLGKATRELLEADYKVRDLKNFESWWYKNDWRGKQAQPPSPANIITDIGKMHGGKPVQTEEQIQAERLAIAKSQLQ